MHTKRPGFTLVEIMIAMALTLFVMSILTQAFVTSLQVFSQMKGLGDLEDKLRTASISLRHDLSQHHFEGDRKLSDPNLVTEPIREGFFHIRQGSAPVSPTAGANYIFEGQDQDSLPSFRAVDHLLHFSVRLKGNRRENFFSANVPGALFPTTNWNFFNQPGDALFQNPPVPPYTQPWLLTSQWGEIAYFLVKQGTTYEPDQPANTIGTPLYSLYRCQFVVLPNTSDLNAQNLPASSANMAFLQNVASIPDSNGLIYFLNPTDLGSKVRTFNPLVPTTPRPNPGGPPSGGTILLRDVVSFQVQVLRMPLNDFQDVAFPEYFDTSEITDTNKCYPIYALQITIRLFDRNTTQSRQVTIVQQM